jgi:penicillin-binding protein 1C
VQLPICANTGLKPTPDCSSVVQEYFSLEDKIAYENSADFRLSPVYDEWLAKQPQANFTSDNLRILSPRNGDLFLLSPGAQGQQKLEFKLAGNSHQSVEWWLNGQKLSAQSNNERFWHLRPGNWTLEARVGQMHQQINFRVEVGNIQPTRQGFSVAHPTISPHSEN